jgi:hypothetical protein
LNVSNANVGGFNRSSDAPSRVWGFVHEWARRYRSELQQNWTLLKTRGTFARMRVQSDTVTWDNGFDLAPEFLYEQAHRAVTAVRG